MKIYLTDQKENVIIYLYGKYNQYDTTRSDYIREIEFDTVTNRVNISGSGEAHSMPFDYKHYIVSSRNMKIQKIKKSICDLTN